MSTATRLTLLLLRRGGDTDRGALVLPVAAFAVVTALTLTVLGGARFFFTIEGETAPLYEGLAGLAVILLIVPLLTMCGSAARLSARRRDEHLSTLRLLGAPARTVTSMTVLESTLLAAAGTVCGVLGHLLLAPVVGLVTFHGTRLGAGNIVLGVPGTMVCMVALVVVAAVSSLIGLQSVVVSPLGVRTRQDAPRMGRWRVAAIAVAIVVGLVAGRQLNPEEGTVALVAGLAATFGVTMGVLNALGPWVLRVLARRQVRTASGARSAERLLAARTVLDSPKAAWRQVSGVALTSFVAVFAGVGLAFSNAMADSGPMTGEQDLLLLDLRTGILLTLVISFVTVAASVAVNQSADILDRRDLYVSLDRMGMPRRRVDAARRRAVLSPLRVVTLGSALVAALLIAPLSGIVLITDPLSGLVIAAALAVGIGTVWLALLATAPLLARVTGSTVRAAD